MSKVFEAYCDGMNNVYTDLFSKEWSTNVAVLQKDINYISRNTYIISDDRPITDEILYINATDAFNMDWDTSINRDVVNDIKFKSGFQKLCKSVIDTDFKVITHYNKDTDYLTLFKEEQHGSGVTALFYVYYNIVMALTADIHLIVIDNIDGLLHPIAMRGLQTYLVNTYRTKNAYARFILSMYQTNLFELYTFKEEAFKDLFVLYHTEARNIKDCTSRELRLSHNLERMLRCGEFNFWEEIKDDECSSSIQ